MLRALAMLVVVTSAVPALAISSYRSHVPNGNLGSCRTCHVSAVGGEGWNAFGKDVLRQDPNETEADIASSNENVHYTLTTGPVWDANLCNADSDGDGQTNGQELGDPLCVWTFTSPATPFPRTHDISNPGDPASTSADPTGVDGGEGEGEGAAEGEGEGAGAEGEGAAEGEGEGEGTPPPGCPGCTSTGDAALPLVSLLALLFLRPVVKTGRRS